MSWRRTGASATQASQRPKPPIIFGAPAFANPKEDDPVNNALDSEIKFTLAKRGVAEREVAGEFATPGLDCFEELLVNIGSASLDLV